MALKCWFTPRCSSIYMLFYMLPYPPNLVGLGVMRFFFAHSFLKGNVMLQIINNYLNLTTALIVIICIALSGGSHYLDTRLPFSLSPR